MRLTDAEILDQSFSVAQKRASPEEHTEIQVCRDALRVASDLPEVVEACAGVYEEIHHLLVGSNEDWDK